MARFIELTQVYPGLGKMLINVDYIIKIDRSDHADGGTDIIVKDGMACHDSETGYTSYTVKFRVKESYVVVREQLMETMRGMK